MIETVITLVGIWLFICYLSHGGVLAGFGGDLPIPPFLCPFCGYDFVKKAIMKTTKKATRKFHFGYLDTWIVVSFGFGFMIDPYVTNELSTLEAGMAMMFVGVLIRWTLLTILCKD